MQLTALENHQTIDIWHAERGHDYLCSHCRGRVRLRAGSKKTAHFYHLQAGNKCYLQGKTAEHLQTQLFIKRKLPEGEAHLEVAFPEIGRIADVVWESRKLIFEVQRSPISVDEIIERNKNYAIAGYKVIWVLHDTKFNKQVLSDAEYYLRTERLSLFANISKNGKGEVYDQKESLRPGKRSWKGASLQTNLSITCNTSQNQVSKSLPEIIEIRVKEGFYFKGDLLDHYFREPRKFWLKPKKNKKSPLAIYTGLVDFLLEKQTL